MRKKSKIGIISISVLIAFRFWIGIYIHDEFGEKYIFVKHRPIWKWKFYSPIGMSDLTIEDLTPEKRKEQILFNEFITERGLSR